MENSKSYWFKKLSYCLAGCGFIAGLLLFPAAKTYSQSVTEIITDYNGWWKTSSSNISPVLPDNHHNLLSFMFNGTRYSTGVNDAALTAHGETFTAGQYHALPLDNFMGTPDGSTKIGIGALADGVANGAGPAPSRALGPYLNDGVNGLDLGTGIANLPAAGQLFLSVSNIQSAKIGDGIPDILVTQIADPTAVYDAYEFTDINGNRIGSSINVVMTSVTPIGAWVADFYEATGSTVLSPGFQQTQRNIRLWAADFSAFGLNASNVGNIAYFKMTLSGTSDIAFVAYNTSTISVQQVLDISAVPNRLRRETTEVAQTDMTLMPNPAVSKVMVKHPKSSGSDRIVLYDNNGIPVKSRSCVSGSTGTEIDLGGVPGGLYQAVFFSRDRRLVQRLFVAPN